MNKLTLLPLWQQYTLAAAWVVPWIVFGIYATDVLPVAWRFQTWPEAIRRLALVFFTVFLVADVLISIWFAVAMATQWRDCVSKYPKKT